MKVLLKYNLSFSHLMSKDDSEDVGKRIRICISASSLRRMHGCSPQSMYGSHDPQSMYSSHSPQGMRV
jgi:hypothetical protein